MWPDRFPSYQGAAFSRADRFCCAAHAVLLFFRAESRGTHAMQTLWWGRMALVSGLWLLAACGHGATSVPSAKTASTIGAENTRSSQRGASCKKDSECPAGQRCGFTGATGCDGSGKCVVAVAGACFDPGGRCGCDGQPVDLFCAAGSSTEFASAPVGSVGPCPRPCTEDAVCPSHLVCRKGIGVQQQNGRVTEVARLVLGCALHL